MQRVATPTAGVLQTMSGQAFTDLLAPLVQPAYRLACAMLHDATAAEDVVQEASFIAWRKFAKLDDAGHLRAWYLGIVANECRNARRRRWWNVSFGLAPTLAVGSGEDRTVSREDVRKALRRLPHEDRLVVSLYFYLDLPVREIAAIAGASVDATRQRLHRAVRRLRPDLEIEEALR